MDQEFVQKMHDEDYFLVREVPGRGYCGIRLMIMTVGLFYGLDDAGHKGRYCYPNLNEAQIALLAWTGDGDPPLNWIKHKGRVEYWNPANEIPEL